MSKCGRSLDIEGYNIMNLISQRYCKEQGTGDNSVDPRSPTSEYNRTPVPSGEGDASTGDEEEPSECADQVDYLK